jgi:hypothetical protein
MHRLAVRVQPGAKTSEIVGWTSAPNGQAVLKIRLRAPPVEGKANAALCEFLAEALGLRARQVTLERGEKSRDKIVLIDGATAEQIRDLG